MKRVSRHSARSGPPPWTHRPLQPTGAPRTLLTNCVVHGPLGFDFAAFGWFDPLLRLLQIRGQSLSFLTAVVAGQTCFTFPERLWAGMPGRCAWIELVNDFDGTVQRTTRANASRYGFPWTDPHGLRYWAVPTTSFEENHA